MLGLLQEMLQINQDQRISWEDLISHPLLKIDRLPEQFSLIADVDDLKDIPPIVEHKEEE